MDKFNLDHCEINCIHQDRVKEARQQMFAEEVACSLSELFRVLGDATRAKMLYALKSQELCVCDLAAVTGSSESSVSHHLRLLRTQNLVRYRREGKVLYYSLADQHVAGLLEQGLEHVLE
ncbi:MAG: ArsR/SmtB family transcription factor [Methylocystaceae bacterium]